YDFCKVNEGTMSDMGACAVVMGESSRVAGLLEEKKVVAGLEPDQRAKWAAADKAWVDFVDKSAAFYAGTDGSIRLIKYPAYVTERRKERAAANADFSTYEPDKSASAKDLGVADKQLNNWYAKALKTAGGSQEQKFLREAQRAWIVFRDAETAL